LSSAPTDSILDEALPADAVSEGANVVYGWVLDNLLNVDVIVQLGLILAALIPALVFGTRLRKLIQERFHTADQRPLVKRLTDAFAILATPIALYLTLVIIRIALGSVSRPTDVVSGAIALMSAYVVVRGVTLVIRSQFWSRLAFYIAWPLAALDAFGYLAPVVEQMRELAIPLGTTESGRAIRLSLLDIVRTLFYFAVLFWLSIALSRLLQSRIDVADDLSPSLKALMAKTIGILLPVIAIIIALQVAGFNLATLAVFSGAVGLGIGLGLQRIAANFIAGFTLIADKSIKPGDVIEIDNTFGWVTAMQGRYVAIRTRDGTELLIPNDRFMTEGVINWSRSDRVVRLHAPFGVAYSTPDLRRVQELAVKAAGMVVRVVRQPAPVCNLVGFGDSSVDFDLRFWIRDPQNGMANVRSQVMIDLWRLLKEDGIEIPYPQRDLHLKSLPVDGVSELAPPNGEMD
jgi:small-conductance mechanosensitive channel